MLTLLISSISFSKISYSQESTQLANSSCKLRVAWTPWSPFIVAGTPPNGIHIELMNWVAKETKCQLIYKKLAWRESVEAIKNGEVDILGRAGVTEERKKFAHFSQAYRKSLIVLYVRKGTSKATQAYNLENLLDQGLIIGVQEGTYYGKEIKALRSLPKYKNSFLELPFPEGPPLNLLLDKTIDGLIESPLTIDSKVLKLSKETQIEEYPLDIFSEDLHFMFSKKTITVKFVEQFNLGLDKVKQSPEYQKHWYWKSIK